MAVMETQGERLKARREAIGVRQAEFAVLADVSQATLRRYETDQQAGGYAADKIHRALLRARIEYLGVSAGDLADVMRVSVGQAERIVDDDPKMAPALIERAHRALDLIERRMSAEDYREERPA